MKLMDICVVPTYLPIVNNAAMHVHYRFLCGHISFLFGGYLRVELMQFYGNCLMSKKIKIMMFLIWKVY